MSFGSYTKDNLPSVVLAPELLAVISEVFMSVDVLVEVLGEVVDMTIVVASVVAVRG